ncbi:MAG: hypothetical protein H8D87_15015 [Deltaproteobacteria bacterium]|uniref:hypothetical protein n=1 Tax=Desulfobacula sp. TaxID=2593537 RepID=UPI00198751DB|nr:hypothetical protein [Candidatus Desulfobacula maris]MBL6996296.1 hypothetical protein [Desulfobacula sp.]
MGIFSENIRDGFAFDPIEVAPCPDNPGWYRLLDGIIRISSRPPCHPSASMPELFLQCRKKIYWALSAGM